MDKLFPINWESNAIGARLYLYAAIIVAVNCLILASYVFTACFMVWLWFGGWL